MAKFDEGAYKTQLWPPLEDAVNMLLVQQPGVYLKISYEEMYRHVYTSVCNLHSPMIYADLLDLVTEHLSKFSKELEKLTGANLVEEFHSGMKRYTQAIGSIVPIFAYLNRTYVTLHRKSDLKRELLEVLSTVVIERHVHRVLSELFSVQSKPFSCSPSIAADLVCNLYDSRPGLARIYPQVFAKFIPNILPPTREDELPMYIKETQEMQQELSASQDFKRFDSGRKRGLDDMPMVKR